MKPNLNSVAIFQVSTALFCDISHHPGEREGFLYMNFLYLTLPGFSTAQRIPEKKISDEDVCEFCDLVLNILQRGKK